MTYDEIKVGRGDSETFPLVTDLDPMSIIVDETYADSPLLVVRGANYGLMVNSEYAGKYTVTQKMKEMNPDTGEAIQEFTVVTPVEITGELPTKMLLNGTEGSKTTYFQQNNAMTSLRVTFEPDDKKVRWDLDYTSTNDIEITPMYEMGSIQIMGSMPEAGTTVMNITPYGLPKIVGTFETVDKFEVTLAEGISPMSVGDVKDLKYEVKPKDLLKDSKAITLTPDIISVTNGKIEAKSGGTGELYFDGTNGYQDISESGLEIINVEVENDVHILDVSGEKGESITATVVTGTELGKYDLKRVTADSPLLDVQKMSDSIIVSSDYAGTYNVVAEYFEFNFDGDPVEGEIQELPFTVTIRGDKPEKILINGMERGGETHLGVYGMPNRADVTFVPEENKYRFEVETEGSGVLEIQDDFTGETPYFSVRPLRTGKEKLTIKLDGLRPITNTYNVLSSFQATMREINIEVGYEDYITVDYRPKVPKKPIVSAQPNRGGLEIIDNNTKYKGVGQGAGFLSVVLENGFYTIETSCSFKVSTLEPASDADSLEPDFGSMTIAELKEYAQDNDIDLGGATLKADIIKVIGG